MSVRFKVRPSPDEPQLSPKSPPELGQFVRNIRDWSRDVGAAFRLAELLFNSNPSVVTKTANYTLSTSDNTVLLNAATLTATLPNAVGNRGLVLTVKLIASATTGTVAPVSGEKIDGASSYSLTAQYKFVTVQSDGANWQLIGAN